MSLKPSRIVVRSVNWLGDAVMSTPALLRLREAYPEAFIALLTPDKLAELWRGHPAISLVLPLAPKEGPRAVASRLRDLRFQIGLVLPNSFRSAFEMWLAAIPSRIGYSGQLRRLLLTEAVTRRSHTTPMHKRSKREIARLIRRRPGPAEPGAAKHSSPSDAVHHIHQYLHLVERLDADATPLAPQLFVSPVEVEACLRRLGIAAEPARPLFALNPGAEYGPAKRWPAESFIAAARAIQARVGCRWVILGGKSDTDLAAAITAGIRSEVAGGDTSADHGQVLNLAGLTTLRDLCAVLKASRVLLTNDTGPMHVAAALGTPVVALFGSTSPELTGPGLPGDAQHRVLRKNVPCAPCFLRQCPIDLRCLRGIEVSEVVETVVARAQAS